ncbi:hypothetical protein, partial [Roseicyclus sp.]|uniref:hypothetical protein n=1 Tax=Roseicyclus sp. TaxID=1914329 RepID=UPI003FA182BC
MSGLRERLSVSDTDARKTRGRGDGSGGGTPRGAGFRSAAIRLFPPRCKEDLFARAAWGNAGAGGGDVRAGLRGAALPMELVACLHPPPFP